MSNLNQIRSFEKQIKDRALDGRVHFYDTPEQYESAYNSGLIGENDVCIVDDILNDETTAISNKQ